MRIMQKPPPQQYATLQYISVDVVINVKNFVNYFQDFNRNGQLPPGGPLTPFCSFEKKLQTLHQRNWRAAVPHPSKVRNRIRIRGSRRAALFKRPKVEGARRITGGPPRVATHPHPLPCTGASVGFPCKAPTS